MHSPSVLIIGAGAAGLAAAGKLCEQGRAVMVLEARDRLGGRICTLRSDWPIPIEAGPEFIHGQSPEFQDLVQEAGLRTVEIADEQWQLEAGQCRRIDFGPSWQEIVSRMTRYDGPDISFATFLKSQCGDLPTEVHTLATEYVEGFNAADAKEVSLRWLRKTEATEGAFNDDSGGRVMSGYDRLTEVLLKRAAGCDIQLSSQVTCLRWKPQQVEAVVATGASVRTIHADAAIVTVPLSILQGSPLGAGCIAFDPALPKKQAAAAQLRVGPVVKVALWFRVPIWQQFGATIRGFIRTSGKLFPTWWLLDDANVLVGWSGGPKAAQLAQRSDGAILEEALSILASGLSCAPQQIRAALCDTRVFNWQSDPLARGAYSYAVVGGEHAAKSLAAPVENTLFFAGEATDDALPATVAGAVRSGLRAAKEVLGVQQS